MRRALGKGLSQLLGEESVEQPSGTLPIEDIIPNRRQPRTEFDDDALKELADSIREHGVIQPLIVRPIGEGRHELIAGERRLRASKLAGLTEVPVVIRTASAQESLEIALIENVQREDISPIECALAYKMLQDEFDLKQDAIARRVGKSRAAIANTLRLLRLPKPVVAMLKDGELSEGHARALLMADTPERQEGLARRIVEQGLTVRDAERIAREEVAPKPPRTRKKKGRKISAENKAIERGLSEHFGYPVTIKEEGKGGRLEIEYYGDADLERILELIGFEL